MPDLPDYFDRLLARHAGLPAASGGDGVGGDGTRPAVRVRPRLPGPFERVEALRAAPADPDEPAPLHPAVPPAAAPQAGERHVRAEREIRTEHRTVLRGEAAPREEPAGPAAGPPAPAVPLLRPAGPAPRGPSTPAAEGVLQRGSGRQPAEGRAGRAAVPTSPDPRGAMDIRPAVAPPPPRASDATAARGAARAATARRASRPAERVVQVQIGRLEVSAAGGPARPAEPRGPARGARPAPSLSLNDYLSHAETRD